MEDNRSETILSILSSLTKIKHDLLTQSADLNKINDMLNCKTQEVKDVKDMNINDIYELNIEDIKQITFEELKTDIVLYTDANELKKQIINTITAEKIDKYIIEYYYKKIELLTEFERVKNNYEDRTKGFEQQNKLRNKLMQLKLTLDTVKDLEALRYYLTL